MTQGLHPDVLQGFSPVIAAHTRLLVLGSFPGVRSLAQQQYYGHPQNHFWKIVSVLWGVDLMVLPYAARCEAALQHGLGLWDVYARCERAGSLDSAIRNAEVNDFAALQASCPQLQAIVHNGAESFKHMPRVAASLGRAAPWRFTACPPPARPTRPGVLSANWPRGERCSRRMAWCRASWTIPPWLPKNK